MNTEKSWIDGQLHPRADLDEMLREIVRRADRRQVTWRVGGERQTGMGLVDGTLVLSLRYKGEPVRESGRLVDALLGALGVMDHSDRIRAAESRMPGHKARQGRSRCPCAACK